MKIFFVLFYVFVLKIMLFAAPAQEVLFLHSYDHHYSWTNNIDTTAVNEIQSLGPGFSFFREYLDASRCQEPEYFNLLEQLFLLKYQKHKLSLIISTDNYALDFLLTRRQRLFTDIPIIFCGVNHFQDSLLREQEQISGICEALSAEETVNWAIKLRPRAKNIILWGLDHQNAQKTRSRVVEEIKKLRQDLNMVHYRDYDLQKGLSLISLWSKEDIVILMTVLQDSEGRLLDPGQTAEAISRTSKAAVFSFFDIFLGHGILGGKLVSSREQGRLAGQMAVKVLQGEPVSSLPVLKQSPNLFYFDYRQIKRFNIKKRTLPEGSIIINDESDFYRRYGIFIFSSLLASVLFIIFLLLFLRQKKKGQRNAARIKRERESFFELSMDMLAIAGFDGYFKQINHAWTKILGWSQEELLTRPWLDFVHPDDRNSTLEIAQKLRKGNQIITFKNRYLCKDQSYKWLSWVSTPVLQDNRIYAVARDITTEKKEQEELFSLAYTDALTKIDNRRSFFKKGEQEFERFKRYKTGFCFLMIDLDLFKQINDSYGHQAGDAVLKSFIKQVSGKLRENDIFGRVGGEEFAIILVESDQERAFRTAERIRKDIETMIVDFNQQKIHMTISIGISQAHERDHSLDDIYQRADKALYQAKEQGRDRVELADSPKSGEDQN